MNKKVGGIFDCWKCGKPYHSADVECPNCGAGVTPPAATPAGAATHEEWCEAFPPFNRECNCPANPNYQSTTAGERWKRTTDGLSVFQGNALVFSGHATDQHVNAIRIEEMHNAALVAEQEKVYKALSIEKGKVISEVIKLRSQLAAERKNREAQGKAYERLKKEHGKQIDKLLNASQQLRSQLDAEREKRNIHLKAAESAGKIAKENLQLRKQLDTSRNWFNDELVRMKLLNELGGPKEESVRSVLAAIKGH